MSDDEKAPSYQEAGVDLEAADETVSRLSKLVESTRTGGVMGEIGGFGGLFSLRDAGIVSSGTDDPVLVSGTDGVGTKLELAFRTGRHDTIGIDCVAMCVNDVATTGARPLFFLDYFATGELSPGQAEDVVSGIARACRESGCALVGGETAEMPGFYDPGEYEIAGFCVGAAQREDLLRPDDVEVGMPIIGLSSTGVHSNGFSLVRKILRDEGLELDDSFPELDPDRTLGEVLMEPTALYPAVIGDLREAANIAGLAHITGGGLVDNVPRSLPDGLGARIDASTWEEPAVFKFLRDHGGLDHREMFEIFNMGIGLTAICASDPMPAVEAARRHGFTAGIIGEVTDTEGVDLEME